MGYYQMMSPNKWKRDQTNLEWVDGPRLKKKIMAHPSQKWQYTSSHTRLCIIHIRNQTHNGQGTSSLTPKSNKASTLTG